VKISDSASLLAANPEAWFLFLTLRTLRGPFPTGLFAFLQMFSSGWLKSHNAYDIRTCLTGFQSSSPSNMMKSRLGPMYPPDDFAFAADAPRFLAVEAASDCWTVIDTRTGLAVECAGFLMTELQERAVHGIVAMLERIEEIRSWLS